MTAQACYVVQPTQSVKTPLSRCLLRVPKGRRMLVAYHRTKRSAVQRMSQHKVCL